MRQLGSLVLIAFLGGCTQIGTGSVGVERTLGKVKQQTLGPGVYFSMFKTVDEFTAKEISLQIQNLRPKSRGNLTMTDVDLDVYFKVNPNQLTYRSSCPAMSPDKNRLGLMKKERTSAPLTVRAICRLPFGRHT